jgi:nucleoside-diphosphate-sugar epimerase
MALIGVVGLGNLGMPIAQRLSESGHTVVSYSRSFHEVPWRHISVLDEFVDAIKETSDVLLGAGVSKPAHCDFEADHALTAGILDRIESEGGKPHYYYFSSGAVYGECDYPKKESDAVNPMTDYGYLKLEIEQKLTSKVGQRVSHLRIGNIFDGSQKSGLLAVIGRGRSSSDFVITAPGNSRRDYMSELYFTKSLEGLVASHEKPPLINVGSGASLCIDEILEIVSSSGGDYIKSSDVVQNSYDVMSTELNTETLQGLIGAHEDLRIAISNYLRISWQYVTQKP